MPLYGILIPIIYIPRFAEIWGRTSMSGSARALYRALVRPEGSASFSQYGEPKTLHQAEPGTKSPARFISTSDADEPRQKCCYGKAVWRLSPFSSGKFCELRDFAGGQNLYVLYAKFPPPKAKRLQLVMPPTPQGRMIAREQVVPRPNVSAFRPRHNIIGPKLCNKPRASCGLITQFRLC